ncbi:MAG: VWA domain-containing protein [Acidobacteriota bacterium]|nr:VWA domain-containing protein [Acidobacteriota bacterium]
MKGDTRTRLTGLLTALVLVAAVTTAQDLTARKGFKVTLLAPRSGEVVSGPRQIRAAVTIDDPREIEAVRFYVNDRLVLTDREPPWQAEYDFGEASAQHVVRVVAHHRDGPTVSDFAITRTLNLRYVVHVQRVVLDVSVRDQDRRLVTGLEASDFVVEEDGRPQRIVEVSREERPILVGIVMDSSGSMRGRMEAAQQAACGFLETLRDGDRTFVVDFDERVFLVEEITDDFDAACKSIGGTFPVGGTALYDALHAAFRVSYQVPSERRALIILSDGDDTESRLDLAAITEEAELSDVTIYAIGLGVQPLSTARSALKRLTRMTGGRAFFVRKAEELAGVYQLIAEELRALYQVVYASDNEVFDGRLVRIRVRVPGSRGYDIRHRQGYRAVRPGHERGGENAPGGNPGL